MAKKSAAPVIRLRGVRHNNLKNFDLDLSQNQLIVVTGLSGSGKSSLAFDTLFAEGQRRYIETFSPYARQFFDRMDKPQVDSIEGIPPAIAIEQRNAVRTTRSTVGTMTEICDYMKALWPRIARLYCRQCGQPVRKDSPAHVWETIVGIATEPANPGLASGSLSPPRRGEGNLDSKIKSLVPSALSSASTPDRAVGEVLITFNVPLTEKISLDESLALVSKQGYQRLLIGGEIIRIDEAHARLKQLKPADLTIVQDRMKPSTTSRARFVEACEQAFHFGKGLLAIRSLEPAGRHNILLPLLHKLWRRGPG